MNKKILKINSWILILISVAFIVPSIIISLIAISTPSEANSWDDLGKFIILIGAMIICILNMPLVISAIGTLRYLKGKNTYKISRTSSIISIILLSICTYFFIIKDVFNIFSDYTTGQINMKLKIICLAIAFFIYILPQITNMVELYKHKNNLSFKELRKYYLIIIGGIIVIALGIALYLLGRSIIINKNKIAVTEENTYSYSDFKSQLESRELIYELPKDKKELTTLKEIMALDANSKYGYVFTEGKYNDFYQISVNSKRKFPMFVYNTYTSLIKKSNETASYYYIGPEDWYINWHIYYINGKIYAAIGDESEYGSVSKTSLSTTQYGIVISEENNITIYNAIKNYYVEGGGILDTRSGQQRTGFPTTTDIYNKKCMKIKVVDKINAQTLDEIAKELSPQYWKEHNRFN